MAWAKGYSGASMGGRIVNTRRKLPVYELNTDTCKVCWSGKGWPCQTKRGSNMKLTHATLRAKSSQPAEVKKPRANAKKPVQQRNPQQAKKPAPKQAPKSAGVTVDQLGVDKDWGGDFSGEWGK